MNNLSPIIESLEKIANEIGLEKHKADSRQWIMNYFSDKYNKTPEQIVIDYIDNVLTHSTISGFGHHFYYKGIPQAILKTKKAISDNQSHPHLVVKVEKLNEATANQDQLLAIRFYALEHPEFRCYLEQNPKLKGWCSKLDK